MTLVYLGGYCTAQQAQKLVIGDSQARARLKTLEQLGFLRRVTKYPVVYQVTKSTTRLLGPDSSCRRRHPLPTVQARLLAVHFYLEARAWPATFFLDHTDKIMMLQNAQCPLTVLPQRNGKPYLREHLVLWLADRRLGVAMIDLPQPGVLSRLRVFLRQYLPALRLLRQELDLLIVTADQSRSYTYQLLLRTHRAIQKLGVAELIHRIKPYSVRQPVPTITELVWPRTDPSEMLLESHRDTDGLSQSHAYPEHPHNIIRE